MEPSRNLDAEPINFSDLLGKNEGQVKINTGNLLKPTLTWGGGGNPPVDTFQAVDYATPLAFSASPVTQFPENIITPTEADIYDFVNNTFLENAILGQVNFWRILLDYSGKAGNIAAGVEFKVENTLSGFMEDATTALPRTATSGSFVVLLATVADGASLPAPLGTGQGYEFSISTTDAMTIVVDSITRINYQKNER